MRRAVRMEQRMIDAALPHHRLAQPLIGKFAREAARCDHDVPGGAVEPADEAPDERGRNGQPRRDIFGKARVIGGGEGKAVVEAPAPRGRSEEHTSELQSLMRISYAVFCLKKNTK